MDNWIKQTGRERSDQGFDGEEDEGTGRVDGEEEDGVKEKETMRQILENKTR